MRPLQLAARRGDLPLLQLLLAAGAQPDLRDAKGDCALGDAAWNGDVPLAEALLQAHARYVLLPAHRPTIGLISLCKCCCCPPTVLPSDSPPYACAAAACLLQNHRTHFSPACAAAALSPV